MPKHFIAAITGPAGSGKTTVAVRVAKQLDKCVTIEADYVKHFIVSGFSVDTEADGTEKWNFNEWELVGESIGILAYNFQEKGFDVIINGYIDVLGWEALEKQVSLTHKILLLPHVEETKNRDKQRTSHDTMGDKAVQEHHDYFSSNAFYNDFIKIDSTKQTIDETVAAITKLLTWSR
jgi:2-phosphoglycerate kinase